MKFGKLAPKRSLKTPALSNFMHTPLVPAPPTKAYWEYRVKEWFMLGNDSIGDCTCAAASHLIMNWTAHGTGLVEPTLEQTIAAYSAVSGYDPSTGANDNGAVELDVLNYWTKTGIAGHLISGYASLDVQNIDQIKAAVYLFGGAYIGFQVPRSAMDQVQAGQAWDVVADDGGIDGGHAVPILGYGAEGCTCITWGALQQMTWNFWQKYCDEAYCVVSADWLNKSGVSPVGLDLPGLLTAMKGITQ